MKFSIKKALFSALSAGVILLSSCSASSSTSSVSSEADTSTVSATTSVSEGTTSGAVTTAPKDSPQPADILRVHYLDVGQGDSIFIELPTHETMLIDASTKEYSNGIISYIKNLGYSKIDYVVATHPHADHIGGLTAVIKSFDVGKIYMSNGVNTGSTYEHLLKAIAAKGKKVTRAKAGVSILNSKDLNINIIAPVQDSYKGLNDYSAVIMLKYKNKSFLFTGDAEALSENQITANVKADVLKVGHHGSTSSTGDAFLKKVMPKYAVISVGKGNDYGHPHQKTLTKLEKIGCEIYRTDLQGTIVFSTDGNNLTVNQSTAVKITPTESTPVKTSAKYVLNTKTKKIHYANCTSVASISKENYAETNDYDKAIADGYQPCKICNPH